MEEGDDDMSLIERFENWVENDEYGSVYLVEEGDVLVDGQLTLEIVAKALVYWLLWRVVHVISSRH